MPSVLLRLDPISYETHMTSYMRPCLQLRCLGESLLGATDVGKGTSRGVGSSCGNKIGHGAASARIVCQCSGMARHRDLEEWASLKDSTRRPNPSLIRHETPSVMALSSHLTPHRQTISSKESTTKWIRWLRIRSLPE